MFNRGFCTVTVLWLCFLNYEWTRSMVAGGIPSESMTWRRIATLPGAEKSAARGRGVFSNLSQRCEEDQGYEPI